MNKLISVDDLKSRFAASRGKSVDEMKIIDETPEYTGNWTMKYLDLNYYYKCSKCETYSKAPTKYCPNCGARMTY